MLKKAPSTTGRNPFTLLGRLAVRLPWLVVTLWIAAVIALTAVFPSLTKVVESKPLQPVPAQQMAVAEQMAADFHESDQNILLSGPSPR